VIKPLRYYHFNFRVYCWGKECFEYEIIPPCKLRGLSAYSCAMTWLNLEFFGLGNQFRTIGIRHVKFILFLFVFNPFNSTVEYF